MELLHLKYSQVGLTTYLYLLAREPSRKSLSQPGLRLVVYCTGWTPVQKSSNSVCPDSFTQPSARLGSLLPQGHPREMVHSWVVLPLPYP